MNIDNELADFEAAGALAEELPWWGWLEDGRSCLTRAGELMSIARLTPSVLDGQTPEQLDRVVDRWQRMLSGVDSRTRLYFYLLRRPIQFEDQDEDEGSTVAALGRRKRRAFLEKRIQSVSAYVAWAHDPGLSAVTTQKSGGPWWMAYAKNWMARRRNQHESVYLESSIEDAAGSFRQLVEASRALGEVIFRRQRRPTAVDCHAPSAVVLTAPPEKLRVTAPAGNRRWTPMRGGRPSCGCKRCKSSGPNGGRATAAGDGRLSCRLGGRGAAVRSVESALDCCRSVGPSGPIR